MKQKLLLSALAIGFAASAWAGNVDFTYNVSNETPALVGWEARTVYDNAIKITDPLFEGARVTGFDVVVPLKGDISKVAKNISGWTSTALNCSRDVNVPDGAVKEGSIANQNLSITFDTPQEIPQGGLWVGYSFEIISLSTDYGKPSYPLAVVESDKNLDYGWWCHQTGWNEWANCAEANGYVSAMVVHLDTDFGAAAVKIGLEEDTYVGKGESGTISAMITNYGTTAASDLGYSITIGDGAAINGTMHLDTPIGKEGTTAKVEIPLAAQSTIGEFPMQVKITTVNGAENQLSNNVASNSLYVMAFKPVKKILTEEYTGLKCQNCPWGYVAMETLADDFSDLFVGTAFHTQSYETGCMVTVRDRDFPVRVTGFPEGDIDRNPGAHAAYLYDDFQKYIGKPTVAAVDADVEWADDTKEEIVIKSSIKFAKGQDNANYRVAFCLTGNGLQNEKWKQSNCFQNATVAQIEAQSFPSPYWSLFAGKGSSVGGLTFNDVVCYFKEPLGLADVLPANIEMDKEYTYEYRIKTADVRNIKKEDFINTGAQVYGVVILLNSDNKAVNCNRSADGLEWTNNSGIDATTVGDAEVVATRWYNLQGVEVKAPAKGIFVKSETLSDGSVRTAKVVVE